MTGYVPNDGGRATAGFKGAAGDCVARSLAIVTGRPYAEIYAALAKGTGSQRATRGTGRRAASARNGVNTKRKWFKDYALSLGLEWFPTMKIGSGCTVHLSAEELPTGRLVVVVSGHYTAMIDGVIHDTFDPRREFHCSEPDHGGELKPGQWRNENGICFIQRRCVYGYYRLSE